MQKKTSSKRYVYQANAIGISGRIVHPFHEIIPSQAASALSDDGGYSVARVDGFRHKEFFSFASAHTEVVGTESEEGVYETVAVSVVEKLNLFDVVTCDRVVLRLTSKYPAVGPDGSTLAETSVVPLGSRFEGLRIGNHVFENLEIAPDYFCQPEHACWSGLLKAVEKDAKTLAPLSLLGADRKPAPLPSKRDTPGVLGFCLALKGAKPGAEMGAPIRIPLDHFGTVHLGEYFCYPNSRSLTMLRVELGCAVQGQSSAAAGRVGGTGYPP